MMFGFCAAWAGHTDDSREMAEDIRKALDAIGMLDKEAASLMGLTVPQLSKQLAGREPLSVYRLCYLPVQFHLQWLRFRSKRIGGAFIEPELVEFLKGAARAGRRMAKAGAAVLDDQKRSA
jgi:hypothetical protein